MVSVAPGMVVNTQSQAALKAQEGIIELLANHPRLPRVRQGWRDVRCRTVQPRPGESRFVEEKRHSKADTDQRPVLRSERCILCDRCTRFADEVAGDALIQFSSRGNDTQITTFPDEPFSATSAANTVQICPVGASPPRRIARRPIRADREHVHDVRCRLPNRRSRATISCCGIRVSRAIRQLGAGAVTEAGSTRRGQQRRRLTGAGAGRRLLAPTTWNAAMARRRLITEAKQAGGAGSIAVTGGAAPTKTPTRVMPGTTSPVHCTYPQMGDGSQINLLGFDRATIDEAANAVTIILIAPISKRN
jgi:NADH-quinone oxidoreductase subunit G